MSTARIAASRTTITAATPPLMHSAASPVVVAPSATARRARGEPVPCNHAGHPIVAAEVVAEIRAAQALLHAPDPPPRPLRQPEEIMTLNLATWRVEVVMR